MEWLDRLLGRYKEPEFDGAEVSKDFLARQTINTLELALNKERERGDRLEKLLFERLGLDRIERTQKASELRSVRGKTPASELIKNLEKESKEQALAEFNKLKEAANARRTA